MAGMDKLAGRLAVLSEPMRLEILTIISAAGTCCASDILGHFDITQPTLSHHMSVLLENDLVTATKQGRFMKYRINKPAARHTVRGKGDKGSTCCEASQVRRTCPPRKEEGQG